MARKYIPSIKSFSNVEQVFDTMLDLGFFPSVEEQKRQLSELVNANILVRENNEFVYSNGIITVKIFKGIFNSFELCNFYGATVPAIHKLFDSCRLSVNGKL